MPLTCIIETLNSSSQRAGMVAGVALEAPPVLLMPPRKQNRFSRSSRLLRHADFERVYKQGRRHFSATMTVFYRSRGKTNTLGEAFSGDKQALSGPPDWRVGFTVGRALGGAVQRNRIKRRLREAVRLALPLPYFAVDVVINPKKSLLTAEFSLVLKEVTRAFAVIEQKLSAGLRLSAGAIPVTRASEKEARS